MNPSPACYREIRKWEGLSLVAYEDIAGVWTIGYGVTDPTYAFKGNKITKALAESLLQKEVGEFADAVNRLITAPLSQPQFDALVCFTYNVGVSALAKSTLRKKLNSLDYLGAAEQFRRWNRAGGKVVKGLTNRRLAEAALFLSGTVEEKFVENDPHPSNIEAEAPVSPSKAKDPGIRGVGLVAGAGALSEAAGAIEPLAPYSEYAMYLFILLTVIAVGYVWYKKNKENEE